MKKLKEFYSSRKSKVIIALVVIAVLIFFCVKALNYNMSIDSVFYSYENPVDTVGGIWWKNPEDRTEIHQTFQMGSGSLSGFALRFGTFQRECLGDLTVKLIYEPTKDNVVVFEETFKANTLHDNQFRIFSIEDPIKNKQGHEFAIKVTATDTELSPTTLWRSGHDVYPNGALFINGNLTATDLNMRLLSCDYFTFNEVLLLLFFCFLIFAVVFMLFKEMFIFSDVFKLKYLYAILISSALFLVTSLLKVTVVNGLFVYTLNILPLVLLVLLLALTIIFEKKLLLYSTVKNFFKNIFIQIKDSLSSIKNSSKKLVSVLKFALVLISFVSTALMIAVVILFLIFNHLNLFSSFLVFILCLTSLFSNIAKKIFVDKNYDAAKLFLFSSIVFGILISYSLPPSTDYSWDSEIHYGRIIDVKEMLFNPMRTLYDQKMEYKHVYVYGDFFLASEDFMNRVTSDYNTTITDVQSTVNLYQFSAYIPPAFVIFIAQMLSMNVLSTITLARFINSIIYSFLIYYGMKKLKSGKLLFAAVSLIPCALFLSAGFNYDFWVMAFIAYAYALFISELQRPDEKISSKTVFKMLMALYIGCGPKMVYFSLGLPMLFMGKKKFNSEKERKVYFLATLTTIALIFISFALPFFLNIGGNSDIRGGAGVDSGGQFSFIIGNPFKYAAILVKFILEYVSVSNMNINIANFCYFGVPNQICGTIGVFLILFAAFADHKCDVYKDRRKLAIITWLSCIVQVVLIATALYISFTPVAHHTVNGCQYRYLFPIMIPFFYFFGSEKIECKIKEKYLNLIIFGFSGLAMAMSVYDVYFYQIALNL